MSSPPLRNGLEKQVTDLGPAKPPRVVINVLVVSSAGITSSRPIKAAPDRGKQERLKHPFSEPLDLRISSLAAES